CIARRFPYYPLMTAAIVNIARARSLEGHIEEADRLSKEAIDRTQRAGSGKPWEKQQSLQRTLLEIAKTQARAGMAEEALRTAFSIPDPDSKLNAVLAVAETHLEANLSGEACSTLRAAYQAASSIDSQSRRAEFLIRIALSYYRAGRSD